MIKMCTLASYRQVFTPSSQNDYLSILFGNIVPVFLEKPYNIKLYKQITMMLSAVW